VSVSLAGFTARFPTFAFILLKSLGAFLRFFPPLDVAGMVINELKSVKE
jgi:hypothetical protein